jgi:hypothetical protein
VWLKAKRIAAEKQLDLENTSTSRGVLLQIQLRVLECHMGPRLVYDWAAWTVDGRSERKILVMLSDTSQDDDIFP